ncbi:uncharacterized protein PAC_14156 [Phialocephala subalpina]|uniref:Uncharacterized protein n=1 Tax=Phialocephala subalpina TaxID=576137 RepID=A0A1L7XGX5_9HELO|nr:uncharacterized protein PAC_14156 [Phialocephala subalpina]
MHQQEEGNQDVSGDQNVQGVWDVQLETETSGSSPHTKERLANSAGIIITERGVTADVADGMVTCDESCLLCKVEKLGTAIDVQTTSTSRTGAIVGQKSGQDILECLARMVAEKLKGLRMDETRLDLEANIRSDDIGTSGRRLAGSNYTDGSDESLEDGCKDVCLPSSTISEKYFKADAKKRQELTESARQNIHDIWRATSLSKDLDNPVRHSLARSLAITFKAADGSWDHILDQRTWSMLLLIGDRAKCITRQVFGNLDELDQSCHKFDLEVLGNPEILSRLVNELVKLLD